MTQVVRSQARMNPRAGQPSHSPARWARHLQSLPARQWAERVPEPTSRAQSGNTCLLSVQTPPLAGEWEASVGPFPPAAHIVGAGEGGSQESSADSWWPAGTVFRPENGNTRHSCPHLAQPQQSGLSRGIAGVSEVRGFHSGNVGSCSHLISQTPGDDCRASP